MFDFLNLVQNTSLYYTLLYIFSDEDPTQMKAYSSKWQNSINIGYANYNSVENLSSVSFILFYLYIKCFICLCYFIVYKVTGRFGVRYKHIKKYTSVNELFYVFMETFFEFILASYFNNIYGADKSTT